MTIDGVKIKYSQCGVVMGNRECNRECAEWDTEIHFTCPVNESRRLMDSLDKAEKAFLSRSLVRLCFTKREAIDHRLPCRQMGGFILRMEETTRDTYFSVCIDITQVKKAASRTTKGNS